MSTPTYITRDQILAALGTLAERDYTPAGMGGALRLRELTRAQLRTASEVAQTADGIDEDIFNLYIFAFTVIDPISKRPHFTPDELRAWRDDHPEARTRLIAEVAAEGLALSEVGPRAGF